MKRTRNSAETTTMQPKIQTIVFEDPDKDFNSRRGSPHQNVEKSQNKISSSNQPEKELDLKRTRYEIMKYAANSLKNSEERISAEEKIILELGGRKEKNKAVNYVVLKDQRKKEREEREESLKTLQKPTLKAGKKKNKGDKKNVKRKEVRGGKSQRK